jgi:probable phosphoglycerate mutase
VVSTRLLLLRHAQSTWNAAGRWQGWADPPLSEQGRAQAEKAAAELAGEPFATVVSSDLVRARQTADVLAHALDLGPVTIDAGLRERDVGAWSGCTTAEIDERWPGVLDDWRAGRLTSPPDGEDHAAFAARVVPAVEHAARRGAGGAAVLVVTHGGVIRAVERHVAADPSPLGNVSGRWFRWDGEALGAESVVNLVREAEAFIATTRL